METTGIRRIRYFTDAQIVIDWLNNHENRLSVYVRNRVETILSRSNRYQWAHVVSGQNPADLISRGCSITKLRDNEIWWTGPKFLKDLFKDHFSEYVPPTKILVLAKTESS